jgi:amino acid transporter
VLSARQLITCRKHNGHSLSELPYQAALGIWGSYLCVLINVLALMASFYTALYPVGKPGLGAENFFINYLAGPLLVFLYLVWKGWSWFKRPADRPMWVATKDIDIYSGMRIPIQDLSPEARRASIDALERSEKPKGGAMGHVMGVVKSIF